MLPKIFSKKLLNIIGKNSVHIKSNVVAAPSGSPLNRKYNGATNVANGIRMGANISPIKNNSFC